MIDKPRFLLIDGHAIIYRAFHAYPELTSPDGQLINAVYGFARILLTSIRDFHPEYIAVCFDHKEKTKRAQEFEAYKAHRAKMPEELIPQIDIIKELVKALNIPQFELSGYEADDLIGTLTAQNDNQVLAIVVTGDKDLLQLVDNDKTHVFIPKRGKFGSDTEYDEEKVKEKMGVTPAQIPQLKALMGDSSDNIPGVSGVGPKTAVKLIEEYGSLDGLYEQIPLSSGSSHLAKNHRDDTRDLNSLSLVSNQVLSKKLIDKLIAEKENAYMSLKLATIERDVPVKLDLSACKVSSYDKDQAIAMMKKYDFDSLINLLPEDEFELELQQSLF